MHEELDIEAQGRLYRSQHPELAASEAVAPVEALMADTQANLRTELARVCNAVAQRLHVDVVARLETLLWTSAVGRRQSDLAAAAEQAQVDAALGPLLDYLNENLLTLSAMLGEDVFAQLAVDLWDMAMGAVRHVVAPPEGLIRPLPLTPRHGALLMGVLRVRRPVLPRPSHVAPPTTPRTNHTSEATAPCGPALSLTLGWHAHMLRSGVMRFSTRTARDSRQRSLRYRPARSPARPPVHLPASVF